MASAIAARFFSFPASFASPSASSASVANSAIAPTPHPAAFTAPLPPADDSQLHRPQYPAPLDEENGPHPPATNDDNRPRSIAPAPPIRSEDHNDHPPPGSSEWVSI